MWLISIRTVWQMNLSYKFIRLWVLRHSNCCVFTITDLCIFQEWVNKKSSRLQQKKSSQFSWKCIDGFHSRHFEDQHRCDQQWLHSIKCHSRSMSEHAQQQSSETSSPKLRQPTVMSLISPVLFLLWQLKMSIMKAIRLLREFVPGFCYCACSLINPLAVTLNGMKPFVGHTCVSPQDVCCETHGQIKHFSSSAWCSSYQMSVWSWKFLRTLHWW